MADSQSTTKPPSIDLEETRAQSQAIAGQMRRVLWLRRRLMAAEQVLAEMVQRAAQEPGR